MLWYIFLTVTTASANLDFRNVSMENWTTCEQFMYNYTYDVNKIVDIEWKIFYSWDGMFHDSYNVWFTRPTKVLIDRFRIQLEKQLKDVNFNDSELFMETRIDFTALFIKTNVSGVYRIVPHTAFHVPYIPKAPIALKVVEPGYLGIMNCGLRYCYALAPVNKMPHDNYLAEAAARLQFWNSLGRSYLTRSTPRPEATTAAYDPDDDDIEFERHFNTF
ncbi:uncharacterized protein LOC134657081 [Cydia amplana]|uniref:uncharacterized protein LOC134657081 n=1 Tax=Cydia amplana TaxID=1869771 RepID=UPI002FE520E9